MSYCTEHIHPVRRRMLSRRTVNCSLVMCGMQMRLRESPLLLSASSGAGAYAIPPQSQVWSSVGQSISLKVQFKTVLAGSQGTSHGVREGG